MCVCVRTGYVVSVMSDSSVSPPDSSVHGILQTRILERVAISSSRGSPNPGITPASLRSPVLAGGFFTASAI